MNRMNAIWGLTLLIGPPFVHAQNAPASRSAEADPLLRLNAHYIAAPAAGQDRAAWLAALREYRANARKGLDLGIYDRPDMRWLRRVFTCHFTFMYDRSFYDPDRDEYTLDPFLDDGRKRFGGYDAVVLWQGYPRLGADPRNQYDMYRDMPGGLMRLREAVRRFHAAGVRVFIDFNPWDTGTRRESRPDEEALADLVAALDADGIFLDTMQAAPAGLRQAIDAARPGVAFVPEGHPELPQLALCGGSWAQWLDDPMPPGLLRLKWIVPAHVQFQIRRWDSSHRDEIRAAFFNGSGMMVWENVFGAYNPWSPEDAALWRKAARILRRFADHFDGDAWEPFHPTSSPELFAHRWPGTDVTLFTLRRDRVQQATQPHFIEVPSSGAGFCVDLWNGRLLEPKPVEGRSRIEVALSDGLGCIGVFHGTEPDRELREWMREQAAVQPLGSASAQAAFIGRPVGPAVPTARTASRRDPPEGMAYVPGGAFRMRIVHQRRECGCYPDPGTPPEKLKVFLWGEPHTGLIHHDVKLDLPPFFIDQAEVSNADYKRFLDAGGYRPKDASRFLAHWKDGRIPPGQEDHPVVYVDLDDARAYARWAGKRLPTEAEWQLAAQSTDGRKWPWGESFDAARCNTAGAGTLPVRSLPDGRSPYGCFHMAGNVWEWTESDYDDGHTRFTMIRGGSWFDAKTSGWYLRGGPQACNHHAKFIRLAPSLDRCATIGFRCVMDAAD
jgi:formylglycine-generating enzyme required for sulfatase activity